MKLWNQYLDRFVPPELRQFHSDASRKHRAPGSGLTLSKHLADILGGEHTIEHSSTDGTTFKLIMPIDHSPQSAGDILEEDVSEVLDEKAVQSADHAKARILVVEDNEVNRTLAIMQLEALGHTVEGVASGEQALQITKQGHFDLILMDCQMPELDGYDTTRRIRELEEPNQRTPIIALTAHAMKGDRERCLEAGMDDYISKPYTQEVLAVALNNWLAQASQKSP